jgi:hypothetical protein
MPWASIGGSIASSVIGGAFGGGSKSAERAAKDAAARAQKMQEDAKRDAQNQLRPYTTSGANANRELSRLLGTADPEGYAPRPQLQDFVDELRRQHFLRFGSDYKRDSNMGGEAVAAKFLYDKATKEWEAGKEAYIKQNPNSQGSGSLLKPFSQEDLNNDVVYQSGLQFGLDEGRKAIDSRARASGSMDSGSVLKELTRFGNDYGSTKANEAYGRNALDKSRTYDFLSGQANTGLSAVGTGIGVSTSVANNVGNSQQNLANTLMQNSQARNNNTNDALQSLIGNLVYNYKNTRNSGMGQENGYTGGSSRAPNPFVDY